MDDNKKYKTFQDLEVWKKSRTFKVAIFELTNQFPKDEKVALSDQLKMSLPVYCSKYCRRLWKIFL